MDPPSLPGVRAGRRSAERRGLEGEDIRERRHREKKVREREREKNEVKREERSLESKRGEREGMVRE